MTRSSIAVLLAVLALPAVSFADQCAWVTAEQAREAAHFAQKGMKFVDYCEPCGDEAARLRSVTIETSEVKETADGVSRELVINGEAKDLAYVFVQTAEGGTTYENLAALAKCKTDGVSRSITIEPKPAKPVRPSKTAPPKRPIR